MFKFNNKDVRPSTVDTRLKQNVHGNVHLTPQTCERLMCVEFNSFVQCAILVLLNVKNRLANISFPAGIYLLKVNNRNNRTSCEICSELTIKIPE